MADKQGQNSDSFHKESARYLERHGIRALMQQMLEALAEARPEDPLEFLCEHLKESPSPLEAGDGQVTPQSRRHVSPASGTGSSRRGAGRALTRDRCSSSASDLVLLHLADGAFAPRVDSGGGNNLVTQISPAGRALSALCSRHHYGEGPGTNRRRRALHDQTNRV